MIRMVVSDVDGTLLNGGRRDISSKILEYIRRLNEKGIIFAAASGRSYHDLWRLFSAEAAKMVFLCSDGALGMYRGQVLWEAPLDKASAEEFCGKVGKASSCSLVVSCERNSYYVSRSPEFCKAVEQGYGMDAIKVSDFSGLKNHWLKLGLYAENSLDLNLPAVQNYPRESLSLIYEDSHWKEFVAKGVHKGEALRRVAVRLKISLEDVLAIGDNYNDKEMLEAVGVSCAMSSGKEEIRSLCKEQCASVEEVLARHFPFLTV